MNFFNKKMVQENRDIFFVLSSLLHGKYSARDARDAKEYFTTLYL